GTAHLPTKISWVGTDPAAAQSSPSASIPSARAAKLLHVILACAIAVLLLAVGFALANFTRRSTAQPTNVVRFSITPPPGAFFSVHGAQTLAISPDGMQLVFRVGSAEGPRLYLRDLHRSEMALIPGTEGAQGPSFSPDGQSVAFVSSGTLKKTALSGGIPTPLVDSVGNELGSFWGEDQYIYFAPGFTSPIMRVPAAGGSPQSVTKLQPDKKELGHVGPLLLPRGK